jgi:hypothetical protein
MVFWIFEGATSGFAHADVGVEDADLLLKDEEVLVVIGVFPMLRP